MKDTSPYYVYILKCADGTLYTGIAKDLKGRVAKHNLGLGAKYTKARLPVKLAYSEKAIDKSTALKREYCIKNMTRDEKLLLIRFQ